MTDSHAYRQGFREGVQSRRSRLPRANPYANIKALREFHRGWGEGYDHEDHILTQMSQPITRRDQ